MSERKSIAQQPVTSAASTSISGSRRRIRHVDGRIRRGHRGGSGIRRDLVRRGYGRLYCQRADQYHQPRVGNQGLGGDGGFTTVEAALAIASLVAVFALAVGGVAAVSTQVRCVDAAREAARLVARGDEGRAVGSARRIGPPDATVVVRREGDFVVASVSAQSRLLPGIRLGATAIAVLEPGQS